MGGLIRFITSQIRGGACCQIELSAWPVIRASNEDWASLKPGRDPDDAKIGRCVVGLLSGVKELPFSTNYAHYWMWKKNSTVIQSSSSSCSRVIQPNIAKNVVDIGRNHLSQCMRIASCQCYCMEVLGLLCGNAENRRVEVEVVNECAYLNHINVHI